MTHSSFFMIVVVAWASVGCSEPAPAPELAISPAVALDQVQDQEQVLATVDGSKIGELDLAVNMQRTFSGSDPQLLDADIEQKVLQSMITSRAIAMQALGDMSSDDQVTLEKRVAQFREELLIKAYLLENVKPHTVTSEQIEDYYNKNIDEFAGKKERLYEVVTVAPDAYTRDPKAAVQAVSLAKSDDDWRQLSRRSLAGNETLPVTHSYQTLVGDTHEGAIEAAVMGLSQGQMSKLVFSNGAPYLVRLLEINQQPSIPLAQARNAIRKKLLPSSMRRSVREVSAQILEHSEVVLSELTEPAALE